jgi:putative FmdB family regulatory protein
MPTYEYRCPDGHDFEKFVLKISLASSELVCPVCGKLAQRRISAGAGLVFKGSGFYITDYGKDGKKDLRTNSGAASSAEKKAASADASAPATPSSGSGDASKASPAKPAASAPVAPAAPSAKKSPGSDK